MILLYAILAGLFLLGLCKAAAGITPARREIYILVDQQPEPTSLGCAPIVALVIVAMFILMALGVI